VEKFESKLIRRWNESLYLKVMHGYIVYFHLQYYTIPIRDFNVMKKFFRVIPQKYPFTGRRVIYWVNVRSYGRSFFLLYVPLFFRYKELQTSRRRGVFLSLQILRNFVLCMCGKSLTLWRRETHICVFSFVQITITNFVSWLSP